MIIKDLVKNTGREHKGDIKKLRGMSEVFTSCHIRSHSFIKMGHMVQIKRE